MGLDHGKDATGMQSNQESSNFFALKSLIREPASTNMSDAIHRGVLAVV